MAVVAVVALTVGVARDVMPAVAARATTQPRIAIGGEHTCAVLSKGVVKCWGDNGLGQLGLGDTNDRGDDPGEMGATLPAVDLGSGVTATAIAAGYSHTCALLSTGAVKCWGYNYDGQLGLGDQNYRGDNPGEMGANLPAVDLGAGVTATAIAAGSNHTCALLSMGAVKCWGYNFHGQLGLGDQDFRGDGPDEMGGSLPSVNLGSGVTARAIAAGFNHTCALLSTGVVKCWGRNDEGQLGLGDTNNRGDGSGEMGATLLAVDLGVGVTATGISGGFQHTCASLSTGAVKCWGNNFYGQLGLGNSNKLGDEANEMGANLLAVDLGSGVTAVSVNVGRYHSCALLSSGAVKCWGINTGGQLGLGDTGNRGDQANEMGTNLPGVDLGLGFSAVALASNHDQSCVVMSSGEMKCWGQNTSGQLGLGDKGNRGDGSGEMGANLPVVDLATSARVTAISAGWQHTCVLLSSGAVKCWGDNQFGQLGLGDRSSRGDDPSGTPSTLPAVDLGAGATATAIAAGTYHTCALLASGAVKCWGLNEEGQLGLGDRNNRGDDAGEMGDNLSAVNLGSGVTVIAIAAGGYHTCALLSSGAVKCWGRNNEGQLGLGNMSNRGDGAGEMGDNLSELGLGTDVTVTAVVAGGTHTCALLSSGAVKCWGRNNEGQLGLGNTSNRGDGAGEMGDNLLAVNLGTGFTATGISSGQRHTCALLSSGAVKCWGENSAGKLGLDDTSNRGDGAGEMSDSLAAVDLGSGVTASAVVAGGTHTCALLSSGAVKCWGLGEHGQLGLGDGSYRGDDSGEMGGNLPAVDLGSGVTATAVVAGGTHTCALLSSGAAKCWGNGSWGQLGLGDMRSRGDGSAQMGDALALAYGFGQAISFTPSDRLLSYTPFSMITSSDSGLVVSLASSTADVCTASGLQVTMVAAGVCTLTASQAGDSYYLPASSVVRSFTIAKNPQTITFDGIADRLLSSTPFSVVASSDSGLAVSLVSSTSDVCTASGLQVTMVAVGVCTLTASQAGDSYYLPASSVVRSFTIAKNPQAITFDGIADRLLSASPFSVIASSDSGLAVSLVSSTSGVCTVSGLQVTLVADGVCTLTASQAGDASYLPATDVVRSFTVSLPTPVVKEDGRVPLAFVTKRAMVAVPQGAKLSGVVAKSSRKVCRMSGSTIVALRPGLCRLTLTIDPKGPKKSTKRISVKIAG
jgi:alpha-tubulin suppressor-like RCC1 family protein